jgi:hypothetical protein
MEGQMKRKKFLGLFVLALTVFAVFAAAYAEDSDKDKLGPYKLLTTVTTSTTGEELVGFDISWVDSEAGRYYLANRGTGTTPPRPNITVIDTRHNKLLYTIPMPPGALVEAPNGVVAIHGGDDEDDDGPGTLVVGGAPNTANPISQAIFIDLAHPFAPPNLVSTGRTDCKVPSDTGCGNHRADELAYDPKDHIILIANDQDTPAPYISFISTLNPPHVLGKIIYDGTSGNPKSTGGIEQPVWDQKTKRFYLAIPSTAGNPSGEVDEIDPIARKITRVFPTDCGPAGLALIPGQRLMTSCGDVLEIATGKVLLRVAGVGGDEIWFNPGDERVYFGGGTDRISVPVVNALPPYNVITTLVVGKIVLPPPTPPPSHTTHSVAADSELNRIFVPVSHEGVKVYTDDRDNGEGPDN